MALADRVNHRNLPVHGLPCSIGTLLEQLEGAELEALQTMLGDEKHRGWSQSEIYDALTAEGYEVGRQSINRHRGGRCRCQVAA